MVFRSRALFWGAISASFTLFAVTGSLAQDSKGNVGIENVEKLEREQPVAQIPSAAVNGPAPSEREKATDIDWSKVECAKPSAHNEADLCEQRRMSRAAESTLRLGQWQLGIGIIGAFLVLWTLHFNRVAAVAARTAAVAATDQVTLSRQALVETGRAFVFVSKIHAMAGFSQSQQRVIDWTIYLVWENSGNTPTRNMRMNTNWHSYDAELPDDFEFPDIGGHPFEVPMMLGPRATTFSGECVIPIEVLEDVRTGKKQLYIWAWVEYNDVFEGTKRHRTESCTRLVVAGDPKIFQHGPNNDPVIPFQYNGYRFFNGADDECFRQPIA